jgi:glycine/D-amino acid oxidase-like deaminating enzyme
LTPPELVPGTVFGITFTTVTINAPMHASHLRSVLEARHGVRFLRQTLPSLAAAFTVTPRVSLVFNCVGGAAETFEGVRDTRSYPTRGQILVARAPGVLESVMRHGRDYETYIIPRPNSGDNVVLGGYMEKRARSGDVLREKSESIRRRTAELMPALLSPNVEVVAAATGLRPSRESGARVERENFGPGRTVVHNYGAGGTGFQSGMGMALDAVALVGQELRQIRQPSRL